MTYAQLMQQGISNPAHSMANGGGSSGGGGTSTTTQEIPKELKPLATRYTQDAIKLSDQAYTPYKKQRFDDFNGLQTNALSMAANRAMNGSATMDNAESGINDMISAGPNPYLNSMVNQSLDNVQTRVNSQFGGNNYGSTAHQETLGRALGDTSASMYGQAYEGDQARRLSAINSAPTFGNQAYQDASQLMNAGQAIQDQNQQGMDFNYQQFQEQQNDPYKKLAAMSGVFGSNLGGSSTTQQSGGGGGK